MPSLQQPPGQQAPGLTSAQVRKRVQAGQVNTPPESPTKTVKKIVLENLFSYFNIIFFIIAGFLIAVGSWTASLSSPPPRPKWCGTGRYPRFTPPTWSRMTW